MPPGSLNDEPDQDVIFFTHFQTFGGGGGCTPLYKGRVGVLGFGGESGMVFEGTTGAYMNGRIYRFSSR